MRLLGVSSSSVCSEFTVLESTYEATWRTRPSGGVFHGVCVMCLSGLFFWPAEEYWQLKDSLNQQAVDSNVGVVALEMEAFNL